MWPHSKITEYVEMRFYSKPERLYVMFFRISNEDLQISDYPLAKIKLLLIRYLFQKPLHVLYFIVPQVGKLDYFKAK